MVDIARNRLWTLLAMRNAAGDAVVPPTLQQLTSALGRIYRGEDDNYCLECTIGLPGQIEGELNFIRIDRPRQSGFSGWLVQLSSIDEFNSFALANMDELRAFHRASVVQVAFFDCLDQIDSRCLLTHQEVLQWVAQELFGWGSHEPFRWIDLSLALSEWA